MLDMGWFRSWAWLHCKELKFCCVVTKRISRMYESYSCQQQTYQKLFALGKTQHNKKRSKPGYFPRKIWIDQLNGFQRFSKNGRCSHGCLVFPEFEAGNIRHRYSCQATPRFAAIFLATVFISKISLFSLSSAVMLGVASKNVLQCQVSPIPQAVHKSAGHQQTRRSISMPRPKSCSVCANS